MITLYFAGKTLEDQGVTHNAKVMVLQLEQSDEETKRKVQEEELQCKKEKEINDKMQRTKKGLEILAERGKWACWVGERWVFINFCAPKVTFSEAFLAWKIVYTMAEFQFTLF